MVGWGEGRPGERKDALLLYCAQASVTSPFCRTYSAAAFPFNQASCKAVISLFKYPPVECSHIHNLMTLIMHISCLLTFHDSSEARNWTWKFVFLGQVHKEISEHKNS